MPEHFASRATAVDSDFRKLIDIAPAMIWVANLDGSCTYLSRSWTTFTGQEMEDGVGQGWLSLIHPDDRSEVLGAFARASVERHSYQTDYRVRARDGSYRWVLDSAAPIFGPSGAIHGFIGSIVDNEQRKTAEIAREVSERRLQVALQASGIGIWQWDIGANQFLFSERARAIFGFVEGDVTFDRLQQSIDPQDLPEVLRLSTAALDPSVQSRAPYRYRITRENDRELRWVEAHGEAQFIQQGGEALPSTYIGTFKDITQEIRRETVLKEESARLALALDAAQLAVWELDILNDQIAPSPLLNVLYGFPPDAQPSLDDLRSRYAPGEKERLEQLGREAAERGEDRIRAEVKHIMPDGSVKWLLVQAQAAPSADGGPRAIGVVMDITERKLHEEQLAVAAREMQHRVKNSLALVQSMVGQSFRADRSIEDGKKLFNSRLQAYAGVTALLSGERKGKARLRALLEQALSPFRESLSEQFVIEAPDIMLPERIAFGVGLAIHELATNAIKYGSLSVAKGVVHVTCRVASNDLYLTWRESGGPPVEEPRSRGFGTKLLQGAVLQGGEGIANLSFLPDGVLFEAKLPLADV